jgi:hypothetical protein
MIDDYNIDLLLAKGILAAKGSPANKALGKSSTALITTLMKDARQSSHE